MTNYRGKVLTISPTGEGGRINEYVCTAHYADHVEIVPTHPGAEGMAFPPIPLSGPGLVGVIYNWREDADLIRRVKDRCAATLHGLDGDRGFFFGLFPGSAIRGTRQNVAKNLVRLRSLEGDQSATVKSPSPSSALNQVFDDFFGNGKDVIGEVHDSALLTKMPKIGTNPNYIGKLVFIEVPLECDDGTGDSGEYVVIQQSADSLYALRTASCQAGLEVVRIPFVVGGKAIAILDSYNDDAFIEEFIERLDEMDADDFKVIECDLSETASRQLSRTLEKNLSRRAKSMKTSNAMDELFGVPGRTSGPSSNQADDRLLQNECSGRYDK